MTDKTDDRSAKDTHYAKLRREFRDRKAGGQPKRPEPSFDTRNTRTGRFAAPLWHSYRSRGFRKSGTTDQVHDGDPQRH